MKKQQNDNKKALQAKLDTDFSKHYIFGTIENGNVHGYLIEMNIYGMCVMFNEKPTYSKGQTVIKYRQSKAKTEYLQKHCTSQFQLCSLEFLEQSKRTRTAKDGHIYVENLGECFEWLTSLFFHVPQNDKPNLSSKDGGDLVINGIHYNIKFINASLAIN